MKFLQSQNAVYLGIVIGLVLLAPYAGCHLLLTQKPANNPDEATSLDPTQQTMDGQDKAVSGEDPSRERKNLSDIEDLLAK